MLQASCGECVGIAQSLSPVTGHQHDLPCKADAAQRIVLVFLFIFGILLRPCHGTRSCQPAVVRSVNKLPGARRPHLPLCTPHVRSGLIGVHEVLTVERKPIAACNRPIADCLLRCVEPLLAHCGHALGPYLLLLLAHSFPFWLASHSLPRCCCCRLFVKSGGRAGSHWHLVHSTSPNRQWRQRMVQLFALCSILMVHAVKARLATTIIPALTISKALLSVNCQTCGFCIVPPTADDNACIATYVCCSH